MARRGDNLPWLLGGLGVALVLLYTQRKTVMIYGAKAVSAASESIFDALLPARAQPYADVIRRVAREQVVEPWLVFALGDRESGWGIYLSPPNPAGTGDYGHGRGLLQIDDRSWGAWLDSNDWTDPYTNVTKGVQILKQNIAFFQTDTPVKGLTDGVTVTIDQKSADKRNVEPGGWPDPRPLTDEPLYTAAIAAYNTGAGNVLKNLAVGLPADFTTTGGNYADDVTKRALALAGKFAAAA